MLSVHAPAYVCRLWSHLAGMIVPLFLHPHRPARLSKSVCVCVLFVCVCVCVCVCVLLRKRQKKRTRRAQIGPRWPKMTPRPPQKVSRLLQARPKMVPKMTPRGSKMVQDSQRKASVNLRSLSGVVFAWKRTPKKGPDRTQMTQDGPQTTPKGPETAPILPKDDPKKLQDGSRQASESERKFALAFRCGFRVKKNAQEGPRPDQDDPRWPSDHPERPQYSS
jgi:hypothetical protein